MSYAERNINVITIILNNLNETKRTNKGEKLQNELL